MMLEQVLGSLMVSGNSTDISHSVGIIKVEMSRTENPLARNNRSGKHNTIWNSVEHLFENSEAGGSESVGRVQILHRDVVVRIEDSEIRAGADICTNNQWTTSTARICEIFIHTHVIKVKWGGIKCVISISTV